MASKSAFRSFAHSSASSSSNWWMPGSLWNRRLTSAPADPAAASCSPSAVAWALSSRLGSAWMTPSSFQRPGCPPRSRPMLAKLRILAGAPRPVQH
eukprot:1116332-Pyramimonas_sp.AAC.1